MSVLTTCPEGVLCVEGCGHREQPCLLSGCSSCVVSADGLPVIAQLAVEVSAGGGFLFPC